MRHGLCDCRRAQEEREKGKSIMTTTAKPEPTPQEITSQYERTGLRRYGIGLAGLLNNKTIRRALQLGALAARRKNEPQQQ